jgi:F-type H+-transporting ATPase subunit b
MELFKLAEAGSGGGGISDLFSALGLNLQAFILNLLAFLLLAWLVGKFVYPHLIKALDAKKDELETAARLESEAKVALDNASAKADDVVAEARSSAEEILAAAKADAAEQLETARAKAAAQGERLVAEAHEQIQRDVLAARRELKAETARLVAEATGAVLGEKLDGDKDRALISRSLERV